MIKKFIAKVIAYAFCLMILVVAIFSYIAINYPGYVDSSYLKFSQKHNGALIIGTSRAAQAIEPSVFGPDVYNFAFTIKTSPFDNTYVKLIKRHHNSSFFDSRRKHIICVDPWALRTFASDPNEVSNELFEEIQDYPHALFDVFYLVRQLSLKKIIIDLITNRGGPYVNDYGRYVVPYDSLWVKDNFEQKIPRKVLEYRSSPEYQRGYYSEHRLNCLKEIIAFLKLDGEVALIRLPVHDEIYKIESEIAGDFDSIMNDIASVNGIVYHNLMPYRNDFLYSDGNHLWSGHSVKLSEILKSTVLSY